MRACWQQIKPLFLPPNIFKLIVISLIQLGATIGLEHFFKYIVDFIKIVKIFNVWRHLIIFRIVSSILTIGIILYIKFSNFFRSNSIRLWMPQLFTMMENFKSNYTIQEYSSSQPRFCYMLGQQQSNSSSLSETLNVAHACIPVLQ